jgi:hypothetical protein
MADLARQVWSRYRLEYVGPVLWMAAGISPFWTFDISVANRGQSEELFVFAATAFNFAVDEPPFVAPPFPVRPGRSFLMNWTVELLGSSDSDIDYDRAYWSRIYTTSRDLVPSIHYYANGVTNGPEFYVSPGDFMAFDVPGALIPPVIGPSREAEQIVTTPDRVSIRLPSLGRQTP